MPAAPVHRSRAAFTHTGTGTVQNVAALADEVCDDPVFFSLLDGFDRQVESFAAPQPAANENREHRVITRSAQRLDLAHCQQTPPLLRGEPIAGSDAETPRALDPSDAGRQLWTSKPASAASYATRRTAASWKFIVACV